MSMKSFYSRLLAFVVSVTVLPATVGCSAAMPNLPAMPMLPGMTAREAPPVDPNVRPEWINNPGVGVSASAGMHIKGRVAQEELAIQRAREEYAKRFGVTIESEQVSSQNVANGRSSTVGQKVSHEETKQNDVKAQIKAKWRDPGSDTFWVLLVPASN